MESNATLFGSLSNNTPVNTYAGEVDLGKSLSQLDSSLAEIDDYNPLGLNTLDADAGVNQEFIQEQENFIGGVSKGDIYSAARNARKGANTFARQKADRHHKAGAAAENLKTFQDYQERENKNKDIDKEVSDFNQMKTQYLYKSQGGVGEYDSTGKAVQPGGFNRINTIETAKLVNESALVKTLEDGFKADQTAWANDVGGDKYISINSGTHEFVKSGDVAGYVQERLLNDDAWRASTEQYYEKELYKELVNQGASSEDAMSMVTSQQGKELINKSILQKANTLAGQSGQKKGYDKRTASLNKKVDSAWLSDAEWLRDNPPSLDMKEEGSFYVDEKLSSSTNLERSLQGVKDNSINEGRELILGALETMNSNLSDSEAGLTLEDVIKDSNLLFSNPELTKRTEKLKKGMGRKEGETKEAYISRVQKLAANQLTEESKGKEGNIAAKILDNPYFQEVIIPNLPKNQLESLYRYSDEYETMETLKNQAEKAVQNEPEYIAVKKAEKELEDHVGSDIDPSAITGYNRVIDNLIVGDDDKAKNNKERALHYIKAYEKLTGNKIPKEILDTTKVDRTTFIGRLNSYFGGDDYIDPSHSNWFNDSLEDKIEELEGGKEWLDTYEKKYKNVNNLSSATDKIQKKKDAYLKERTEVLHNATTSFDVPTTWKYDPATKEYYQLEEDEKDSIIKTKQLQNIFKNPSTLDAIAGKVELVDEDGNVTYKTIPISEIYEMESTRIGKNPAVSQPRYSKTVAPNGKHLIHLNIGKSKIEVDASTFPEVEKRMKSNPEQQIVSKLITTRATGVNNKIIENNGVRVNVRFPDNIDEYSLNNSSFYNNNKFKINVTINGEEKTFVGNDAIRALSLLKQNNNFRF